MRTDPTILIVTDPLCSWCWGMTPAVDAVRQELPAGIALDLVLGGINLDSTQVVGSCGRRLMHKLWKDVADTTGQTFASLPTEDYIHNSLPVCLAVEAVRQLVGHPPFDFLHDLQRRFFALGENTTDSSRLWSVVQDHGLDVMSFDRLLTDQSTRARVQFQFEMAHAFGTHALPSVLGRRGTRTRLLAGGYLDGEGLMALIETERNRSSE